MTVSLFYGQAEGRSRLLASEFEKAVLHVGAGNYHKVLLFWSPRSVHIAQNATTRAGQG
jgi:hypothetical protein